MTTRATHTRTYWDDHKHEMIQDCIHCQRRRLEVADALLSAARAVGLAYEEAGWSKDTRDAIFALNRIVAGATGGQAQ